ncbi:MAG: T9SS type A sorting domain-containing protein, partial [Saprospiraceae bacterium]
GSEIMVALLVTDAGGNTNMCMVTVEVQDKVDAKMTCPADTTVSCNFAYDPDNLNDFFDKPEVYGNCPSSNKMVQTLSGSLSDCGSGTLIRHISLRNAQNVEVDKCNQTIVFENGDPLTYADITWPSSDVDLNGCGVTDITSGMIGIPEIADKDCQLIGINVKSDTFFFAENNSNLPIGACLKIIRKYSVVDWCKNDGPGSLSDPFKFTQIIKLNNTVDPTIANVFVAKTFKSSDVNCGPMTIAAGELTAIASDDCTATSDLVTSYTVYDADDNVVKIGNGLDAAGTYAVGTYTVQFKALDKCGNDALTSSTFTIINVKSPTPYCRNGLSTTLIAMDPDNDGNLVEMVMLTPDFFDAGSSHTCGGPVQLSFSADVVDVTASFFCSDTIAPVEVEIWVTDQNGNQDYCVTYLDVQNNDTIDLCNSQKPVTIAGRIYTEEDAQLEDAEVELRSFESVLAMTNDNGLYEFADMPIGGNYKVIPQKDNDLMNGVSTLDLVLIQRHILEIALLDSPYKVLAADINNSESVTASDLAALRKAILGVSNSFPNNTSWRFIDESYTFEDDLDPWTAPLPEKYNIANLSEDMNVDFIAVKVGDINGNVTTNLQAGVVAESRSDNSMTMSLPNIKVETGAVYEIEIQATDATNIFGIQHTFDMNGLELIDMKSGQFEITNNNVYQSSSLLNVSYASAHGHAVNAGNRLFTMIVKATKDGQLQDMISLSNKGLNAESYLGDNIEVSNINIEWRAIEEYNIASVSVMTLYFNSPNPWKTQTTISFELPEAGKVTLKMTDAMGRLISTKEGNFKGGFNNFIINDQDVKAGIILYELKYNNQVINKKMIKVN